MAQPSYVYLQGGGGDRIGAINFNGSTSVIEYDNNLFKDLPSSKYYGDWESYYATFVNSNTGEQIVNQIKTTPTEDWGDCVISFWIKTDATVDNDGATILAIPPHNPTIFIELVESEADRGVSPNGTKQGLTIQLGTDMTFTSALQYPSTPYHPSYLTGGLSGQAAGGLNKGEWNHVLISFTQRNETNAFNKFGFRVCINGESFWTGQSTGSSYSKSSDTTNNPFATITATDNSMIGAREDSGGNLTQQFKGDISEFFITTKAGTHVPAQVATADVISVHSQNPLVLQMLVPNSLTGGFGVGHPFAGTPDYTSAMNGNTNPYPQLHEFYGNRNTLEGDYVTVTDVATELNGNVYMVENVQKASPNQFGPENDLIKLRTLDTKAEIDGSSFTYNASSGSNPSKVGTLTGYFVDRYYQTVGAKKLPLQPSLPSAYPYGEAVVFLTGNHATWQNRGTTDLGTQTKTGITQAEKSPGE